MPKTKTIAKIASFVSIGAIAVIGLVFATGPTTEWLEKRAEKRDRKFRLKHRALTAG